MTNSTYIRQVEVPLDGREVALAIPDGFLPVHVVNAKNGEIIMQQPQIPLESSMMKYSSGVVVLGKADFDRTRALADRFQRNELKVAARLMLVQALLRNLEQPALQ